MRYSIIAWIKVNRFFVIHIIILYNVYGGDGIEDKHSFG